MRRLLLVILIVLLGAVSVEAKMVSVKGAQVNMRSGPGQKYSILWELGTGYPLKVEESKGGWYKVSDFEGDLGWIYSGVVSDQAHMIVKKKRVNVRSGPGQKYKVVGKANYGVVFRTLNRQDGWVEVKHENGLVGWVERSLLWGW
ncbi:MAG: SH3 domain-containing protein [Proteobacteria bacterium]|nr:SH3 domain-containing protein [Pseudomonadota bacterium]MBU1716435.1 SH3 domain-containing protein [Pseudomonadota bacterium]